MEADLNNIKNAIMVAALPTASLEQRAACQTVLNQVQGSGIVCTRTGIELVLLSIRPA